MDPFAELHQLAQERRLIIHVCSVVLRDGSVAWYGWAMESDWDGACIADSKRDYASAHDAAAALLSDTRRALGSA